jgi:superfamily I DNA and/or RNA helicase
MKPFGGKHVILFGDLLQLPAVVKENTTHQIYESAIFENFKPFFWIKIVDRKTMLNLQIC